VETLDIAVEISYEPEPASIFWSYTIGACRPDPAGIRAPQTRILLPVSGALLFNIHPVFDQ
jgi:hypothetical protein